MTNLSDRLHNAGSTKAAQTAAFASTLLLASFVSPATLHAQQDPQTNAPYDLRISAQYLDEEDKPTCRLFEGKKYTLEFLAETSKLNTNNMTHTIGFAFIAPNELNLIRGLQPNYGEDDFFKNLAMDPVINYTWVEGNRGDIMRDTYLWSQGPTQEKGTLARFEVEVKSNTNVHPYAIKLGWSGEDRKSVV